jgi:hypothetical protein
MINPAKVIGLSIRHRGQTNFAELDQVADTATSETQLVDLTFANLAPAACSKGMPGGRGDSGGIKSFSRGSTVRAHLCRSRLQYIKFSFSNLMPQIQGSRQ